MAWLSFIELDKAVVYVIRLAIFSVIMVSMCLSSFALSSHLPFCLFILSGVISPLISSGIVGMY